MMKQLCRLMTAMLPVLACLALMAGTTEGLAHEVGVPAASAPVAAAPEAPAAAVPAPPKIDTGDTTWVLVSTALVLAMTAPGLALFYGGMVRGKNALGTIMQSFIALGAMSVLWVLDGYSLSFGPDVGHRIGYLDCGGLKGFGP